MYQQYRQMVEATPNPLIPKVKRGILVVAGLFLFVALVYGCITRDRGGAGVAGTPLTTYPTGLSEPVEVRVSITSVDGGWVVVDEDGDKGFCTQQPVDYDSLLQCEYVETVKQ